MLIFSLTYFVYIVYYLNVARLSETCREGYWILKTIKEVVTYGLLQYVVGIRTAIFNFKASARSHEAYCCVERDA
jgi:hypothetical protein